MMSWYENIRGGKIQENGDEIPRKYTCDNMRTRKDKYNEICSGITGYHDSNRQKRALWPLFLLPGNN